MNMNIKRGIRNNIQSLLESRINKYSVRLESANMSKLSLVELTKDEKQEISNLWKTDDFLYHRMFKTFVEFDARYVSDSTFVPRVLRALNPLDMARAFENKSLYSILYPDIPQPKTLLTAMGGGIIYGR